MYGAHLQDRMNLLRRESYSIQKALADIKPRGRR